MTTNNTESNHDQATQEPPDWNGRGAFGGVPLPRVADPLAPQPIIVDKPVFGDGTDATQPGPRQMVGGFMLGGNVEG